MVGGFNGYRAALVRRQLTPGLISSLHGTAGLPPFISFSTATVSWVLPIVEPAHAQTALARAFLVIENGDAYLTVIRRHHVASAPCRSSVARRPRGRR